MGNQGEQVRSY